jgi:hypothetical protein
MKGLVGGLELQVVHLPVAGVERLARTEDSLAARAANRQPQDERESHTAFLSHA